MLTGHEIAATNNSLISRIGRICRLVAATIIAGINRKKTVEDVNAQLSERSGMEQVVVVGGIIIALFLLNMMAAQFGWIGLMVFWLAIIVIVN